MISGLSINEPQKWTDHLVKILTSPITHKIIGQINEWVVSQGNSLVKSFKIFLKIFLLTFNDFLGALPLNFAQIHPDSPYLNIYFYPEEIDFLDVINLPPKWHRFDALIRQSDEVFEIPEKLKNKPGKLVYFSMGSFASSYSPMMKQLVDLLKDSLHRFIVSKGKITFKNV